MTLGREVRARRPEGHLLTFAAIFLALPLSPGLGRAVAIIFRVGLWGWAD